MGGFDGLAQGLGNVVGVLAAIESLRSPGGLQSYFSNRLQVQGDPDARASLVGSPFTAGFFGVPGGRGAVDMPNTTPGNPLSLPTPSAPEQTFVPNLPPLGSDTRLKQEAVRTSIDLDKARLNAANNPPDFWSMLRSGQLGGMQPTGAVIGPTGQPKSINLGFPEPFVVESGSTVNKQPMPATINRRQVVEKRDPAERAAEVKSAQEQAKLNVARQDFGKPTLDLIDNMLEATKVLPSGWSGFLQSKSGVGSLRSATRLGTGDTTSDPQIEQLRQLRGGDLLVQQLYRLSAVGVATEQDVAPYVRRLRGLEGMGQEEAQNRILEVRSYIIGRLFGGRDPNAPGAQQTQTTTPGSSTTTTQPPLTGEQPATHVDLGNGNRVSLTPRAP